MGLAASVKWARGCLWQVVKTQATFGHLSHCKAGPECSGVLFVKDKERRQTDVRNFLLTRE